MRERQPTLVQIVSSLDANYVRRVYVTVNDIIASTDCLPTSTRQAEYASVYHDVDSAGHDAKERLQEVGKVLELLS